MSRRYHVYEVQTRNTFPLAPKENTADAPLLQLVMWAPNSATSNGYTSVNNGKQSGSSQSSNSGKTVSQAIAFVHENDLYYKPKVQGDLVCRLTTTGKYFLQMRGFRTINV